MIILLQDQFVLSNNTVECVTTYKLLGIIISNDLKWNEHINYISKKASKRLYSLRILKKVRVNKEGILKVYLTTIRPILEYGVQIRQDIPEFLSNKLESTQKRALHIIYPWHSYLDALNTSKPSIVIAVFCFCYWFFLQPLIRLIMKFF